MVLPAQLERMTALASQVSEREGCRLYDIELHGRIVRVLIDKEAGVSLDDCERVSRGLDLLFDVENIVEEGTYTLEVSSPGLERRMTQPWHFGSAVDQIVKVSTKESIGEYNRQVTGWEHKRMNAKGILKRVDEVNIYLEVDNTEYVIPFSIIDRSHLVFDFEKEKNKKDHKKG